jgi:hypothetical protein
MTLPTGTITINDIRTEYGLSGALALGSLYAGGSIIAAGSGGINGAIPSSGAISLNNFKGHSAPPAIVSSVEVQPAAKYSLIAGGRGYSYEGILHGFGQTYTNTYSSTIGSYNSNMASSIKTDSAQGSIISSPDLTVWGPSSGAIGTLRSITHLSRGGSQGIDTIVMIVESTGSNSNAGFTNLVATRSGMTTLTLARSSATLIILQVLPSPILILMIVPCFPADQVVVVQIQQQVIDQHGRYHNVKYSIYNSRRLG